MTPTTLAAAILRDVRLFVPEHDGLNDPDEIQGTLHGWCRMRDVLAALTAALDPAIAERAGEVLEGGEFDPVTMYEEASGFANGTKAPAKWVLWAHSDLIRCRTLITALLAQNAALRADKEALHLALGEASKTIVETKAERDALRAEREKDHAEINLKADFIDATINQLAAAEAQIAALTARVEGLTGALKFYAEDGWKDRPLDPPTPEEVELFGGNILDFPMPEVFFDRGERARAALSATTEESK